MKVLEKSILIFIILFVGGCSSSVQKEDSITSCLIEDAHSKKIVMCFEGELEFVKSRCQNPNKIGAPKVTFSTTQRCPKDRENYLGHCNINKGEYIPFSYAGTSPYLDSEKIKMMEKMTKDDCVNSHNGQWVK